MPRSAREGEPGALIVDAGGRVASVVELDIDDGVVRVVHAVSNPDKLGHLGPVCDIGRLPEKGEAERAGEGRG
ncbi:hypothetical protein ACIQV3_38960 [Streptomyces sp. NPDC099050]|uniref:hypothetical protein n=1 Tax=Streptomyces sp. NPDC099050 TaxID=3366100 RepID=UPI00382B137D